MLRRPIFAIIGIFILLFSGSWLIFNIPWGGSSSSTQTVDNNETKLIDYAKTPAKTRMVQKGEVVNDKDYREVHIIVSRFEVEAKIIQGFEGNVIKSARFKNNEASYGAFLEALDGAGFGNVREQKPGSISEGESCPRGIRFVFDITQGPDTKLSAWAASCSKKLGTYLGDISITRRLFEAQVPDYSDFKSGIRL